MFVFLVTVNFTVLANATALSISTLYEDGTTLLAHHLEYWFRDDPFNKFTLDCESDACSSWQFPAEVIETRTIVMIALVEKPGDPTCSDWYIGELSPERLAGNDYTEVQLKHTETACK